MKLLSSLKIATLATVALTFSLLPNHAQEASSFPDIEKNLFKTEIKEAVKMGIIEGFPDGTFRPNEKVTREQAAVMIFNAIDSAISVDINARPTNRTVRPFLDVPADRWSAKYINWIQWNLFPANTTVLTGNFRPEDPITRIELVSFLRRTVELLNSRLRGNPELNETEAPVVFSDLDTIKY